MYCSVRIRTPLYYGQFVWSQKCQKSYIPYLYNTDTSVKRTLGALSIQQKFRFEISELNFTCSMERYIPVAQTRPKPIVASQQTQNFTLKEKSKYWLYPKEHSTVEKGRCKTKGGGILFRVESL